MGYQVLARKYRPQRFADVAGQDHVTRTLINALTQNRVAHGYIFSGHRGIGKTTIARIVAQALNCHHSIGGTERPTAEPCGQCDSCMEIRQGNAVDVIEIDAATNRGIDEIRELRDAARYSPARDRYKIYILDEAHQITEAAFNALLKTLEEPPPHIIFMMATTQPEDIPQTIRSRCQHFSFHAVRFDDILAQLKMIAEREEVTAEDEALSLLAEAGDGSMRDALSIMDQAIASAPVENGRPVLSGAQIRDLMGSVPNAVFERLMESAAAGQSAELMEQLNLLLNAGHNPSSLARQMVRYLRNALMARLGGEQTELLQISADERARAARTALLFSEEELTRNLQIVLRTFDDLNYRQEQRLHLELGLLKLIHARRLLPIEELLSGIAAGADSRGSAVAPAAKNTSHQHSHGAAAQAGPRPAPLSPFGASESSRFTAPKPADAPSAAAVPATVAVKEQPTSAPAAESPVLASAGPQTAPGIDELRKAVTSALAAAGHSSAAQLLEAGNWNLERSGLHIEAGGMGKKMLALTVNAAAEKIIRRELQRLGAPTRFTVVPGENSGQTPSSLTAPPSGSVQQAAVAHPLVQRAREIFKAELRSVVDLHPR